MEPNKAKIIHGSLVVLSISIIAGFFAYILRSLLARQLSQYEFGLFYAIMAFVGIFGLFKDFGISNALFTFIPGCKIKEDLTSIKSAILSVFLFQFVTTGIMALVFILLSSWLAVSYFRQELAVPMIIAISLAFWLESFQNVMAASFRGLQNMLYYALADKLIKNVLFLFFAFIALRLSFGVVGVTYAFLLAVFVLPFFLFPLLRRAFPRFFALKTRYSSALYKTLFSLGLPIMLYALGHTTILYTDTLMLTYFRTLEEVALYNAAIPAAIIIGLVPQAITAVFLPLSSELWKRGDTKELGSSLSSVYIYTLLIMCPMVIVSLFFPEFILSVLFGATYTSASLAFQILAVGTVFYGLAIITGECMIATGKSKQNVYFFFIAAILNVVLNYIMIPRYGIVGSALASALSYFLLFIFQLFLLRTYITLRFSILGLSKIILINILLVVAIVFTSRLGSSFFYHLLSIAAALLLYGVLLFLFDIVSIKDLKFLGGIKKENQTNS